MCDCFYTYAIFFMLYKRKHFLNIRFSYVESNSFSTFRWVHIFFTKFRKQCFLKNFQIRVSISNGLYNGSFVLCNDIHDGFYAVGIPVWNSLRNCIRRMLTNAERLSIRRIIVLRIQGCVLNFEHVYQWRVLKKILIEFAKCIVNRF